MPDSTAKSLELALDLEPSSKHSVIEPMRVETGRLTGAGASRKILHHSPLLSTDKDGRNIACQVCPGHRA